METFRSKEIGKLFFKNYQRVDEVLIFQEAKNVLENDSRIIFNKFQEVIWLDIWNGTFNEIEFELCLDINYGVMIVCTDEKALLEIEKVLNH